MSLTIVIPTIGRPTLVNALRSVGSLQAGDRVLVIADGLEAEDAAHAALVEAGWWGSERPFVLLGWNPALLGWGHAATNDVLDYHATTSHVCRLDDDDVYLPGALDLIREVGCRERPVVFKARWGAGHPAAGVVLWHRPEVRLGNVATPMVVWPAAAKARFGLSYTGDYDFYVALEQEYGELAWDQREIVEVRPVAEAA